MTFVKNIFVLPLLLVMFFVAPTVAADNGCDDPENDYVTAELALCSTHAYNINEIENPKESSVRQEMNNIIAMKTTVITQQLYKQYDMMESMLARFKTQLEKAVLTSKMGAAGAKNEEDNGGSYRSNDKYIVLSGATNCLQQWSNGTDAALECLNRNVQTVINALNAGNTTDARKQLEQEIGALETITSADSEKPFTCDAKSESCSEHCRNMLDGKKDKQTVLQCAYSLSGVIVSKKEARKKSEMEMQRYKWGN